MKNSNSDTTHLYSQDKPDLDDALKTYEETVSPQKEKRPFPVKKLLLILCIIAVLSVGLATTFFLAERKVYSSAVVKTSDGKYALAGKNFTNLDFSIKDVETSFDNSLVAFTDSQNNLYALKTAKYKDPDDAKLVAAKFTGDYFVFSNKNVVYLTGEKLLSFGFNGSSELAQNVSKVFHCENSEKILYLTNDKNLYCTDCSTTSKVASNVNNIKMYSDTKDMNVVFVADGGLYFCDKSANPILLSENSTEWMCGQEDEVWDSIYFFEKSQSKKSLGIEFTDSLAQSDAQMKEPVSSDYKQSYLFGFVQYVDPIRYKAAYIEYQEKLNRDKIREYIEGFNGEAECLDVFCYNSSGVQQLKQNVFRNEVILLSNTSSPLMMMQASSDGTTRVDVSEIADVIKLSQIDSQKKFDDFVLREFRRDDSSDVIVCSPEYEVSFHFENSRDYGSLSFSNDANALLLEKDGEFTLYKLGETSLETVIKSQKGSLCFFDKNKLLFVDENNELFLIDFLSGFEKTSVAKNVEETKKISNNSIVAKAKNEKGSFDFSVYRDNGITTFAENCSDFSYVNNEEFFYVSQDSVFCKYGEKLYVHEGVREIVK